MIGSKKLKIVLSSSLIVVVGLLISGCQSNALWETPAKVTPAQPSSSVQNPVFVAFRHLAGLDSYRMTMTFIDGYESRRIYLFEKRSPNRFRIIYSPGGDYQDEYIVVNGDVYSKLDSEEWTHDTESNGYDMSAERFWWFFPTIDNGCWFDETDLNMVEKIYDDGILFRTLVILRPASGVAVDPGVQCFLSIDNDGYPRRIVSEALREDYTTITLFTNFGGEDIKPIEVPLIK